VREVAKMDVDNLAIIRDGVTSIIRSSATKYDKNGLLVLDIAPQVWNGANEFYKLSTIETLDIDKHSGATYIADITSNNSSIIDSNKYDVVIFTEVLEHTLNPFAAINEIHRILKKGGVLVMTTPFNFRIHNPLPDCWRFSEHGLRELLKKFTSVEIEENGTERFLFPVQYKTIAIK
jgi:SAM-dependent methyltransferase